MGWIDSIPVPALRLDSRGRVREANRLALRRLECQPRSLIGATRRALSLRPGANGSISSASEIPLAKGSLLLLSEESHVDRLQQQIYHLSRLASAGRLVAVVVHEINNALSGILGYAQFLLSQPAAPEARRDLERIHDEALRTARVVQNLLRFSRGGKGERALVRIDEILQRCAELKRRDFALRSIRLEMDVAPRLPPLLADEALISQVFVNLLTNAQQSIGSARDGGLVEVKARMVRRRLVVEVEDDGPGIPRRLRERVFEPFFTSRRDGSGTGLGLTLCREILNDHGADIRVGRRGPPGCSLRLSFPVATGVASRAKSPATTPAPIARVANCRIVVVEDEPAVRDVVSRTFAGRGNHTITFERGEDALPYLEIEPVDLIVTDVHRPGVDGVQLYEHLAHVRPALLRRILFITGDALDGEVASFLRRTRVRVMRKPLRLDELEREASEIVARPIQQRELFA
jgi:signal transduction histidine kinase